MASSVKYSVFTAAGLGLGPGSVRGLTVRQEAGEARLQPGPSSGVPLRGRSCDPRPWETSSPVPGSARFSWDAQTEALLHLLRRGHRSP